MSGVRWEFLGFGCLGGYGTLMSLYEARHGEFIQVWSGWGGLTLESVTKSEVICCSSPRIS